MILEENKRLVPVNQGYEERKKGGNKKNKKSDLGEKTNILIEKE